jgi:hypothetical protein
MILTVTPGINLSSVTGPISKAQLNQLGQPTVALSPGSVVAADTNFTSLRITDGVYPFLQLTNLSAPTDKKKVRGYVEIGGKVEFARVNDAETVGTNLIAWDVNNNCGLGTGVPQAKQHVVAQALSSVAGSVVDIARFETTNPNVSYMRLMEVRNSTGGDWTTTTTRLQKFVDGVPHGFIEFNPAGLSYAVALGAVNGGGANVNVLTVTGSAGGNNVGIGTTSTPEKLSVNGNVRLVANGNALLWTDQSGTTPYMVAAVDGNFYFAGTTAAGAGRSIFRCAMRSDSSPLQIDVPLKIGAAGVEFKSVLKATVTQTPNSGSPLAAGTLYQVTSTVTGALPGALIIVKDSLANKPNLVLSAACLSADSVTVYYLNEGTSSFNWGTQAIDLYVFNT